MGDYVIAEDHSPPAVATKDETPQKALGLSADEEEIASNYRKMLKMGMPQGAVLQKMSVDDVAQHIQDSVIGDSSPSLSTSPTDASKKASNLNGEEEEIASKYRKMLKMGMPEGAVIQKMS